MRYKPEHKDETRKRIVESASKQFRAHGFEEVGVAKLMGNLNLTHGGFYAHFADKEELVAEASTFALEQSLEMMLSALRAGGFPAMLEMYLSEGHRDHPAEGCPLPALSGDIARHSASTREAFTKKLNELFDAVSDCMPGQTRQEKRAKFYAVLSSLMGAVALARAVSDTELSKAILGSVREELLDLIEKAN